MKFLPYFLFIFFTCFLTASGASGAFINSQNTLSKDTLLYHKGLEALKNNDYEDAKSFFKKSINENEDLRSYCELARIYINEKTFSSRDHAKYLLNEASIKFPQSAEVRVLFATALEDAFFLTNAMNKYEEALRVDSTSISALLGLARLKEKKFITYHNAVTAASSGHLLQIKKYTEYDYKDALNNYSQIIKYDSSYFQAYLHLGFLYEANGTPKMGIPLMEKTIKIFPDHKDAHLFLGVLAYETSDLARAYTEFQKAILLMNEQEREDFTFNSAKVILEPVYRQRHPSKDDKNLKEFIDYYWRVNDPLRLSKYNERLLEHYFRVAYANIHYSDNFQNLPGWKTDRGEAVLRYGKPLDVVNVRPDFGSEGNGKFVFIPTREMTRYNGVYLTFTDEGMLDNNFKFSPGIYGDELRMKILRVNMPQTYKPKFEGPQFDIVYNILQFKNQNDYDSRTDVYMSYAMEVKDSLLSKGDYEIAHDYGLFITDNLGTDIYNQKGSLNSIPAGRKISGQLSKDYVVNSLQFPIAAEFLSYDLELIRSKDKGVAVSEGPLYVKDFGYNKLSLSDIVLSTYLDTKKSDRTTITRRDISFLPNPTLTFDRNSEIYLYYEVYNLKTNNEGLNEFEQRITIREKEESPWLKKTFNTVLSAVGLLKSPGFLTLTSKYQIHGKDAQMYLRLDMSNYPKGEYILSVNIIDKLKGNEITSETPVTLE